MSTFFSLCFLAGVALGGPAAEPVSGGEHRFSADAFRPSSAGKPQAELPRLPTGYRTLDEGTLQVAYASGLRGTARQFLQETEKARADLASWLGPGVLAPERPISVVIAHDAAAMRGAAPPNAPPPAYAQGVAYPDLRLILLSEAPVTGEGPVNLLEVYRHELAHLALHDALGPVIVPQWFNEGFSVVVSGEAAGQRLESLWLATVSGNLLPLASITESFPPEDSSLAYAQSADLVRHLLRTEDRERFRLFLARLTERNDFVEALRSSFGLSLTELEAEWIASAESRFSIWPLILGSGSFWLLSVGLLGLAWHRKRQRNRATLERWTEEEVLERARAADRERERQRQLQLRRQQAVMLARRLPAQWDLPSACRDSRECPEGG